MRCARAMGLLITGLAAGGCGDGVNVGPTGADQSVETDEDTPVAIELAGTDANGDELSFAIVQSPASGTLSGTAPDVTYTPDPDFFGADMFTYAVSDADETETHEVFIMVLPVNDGPTVSVANADVVTDEDEPAGPLVIDIADVDDDLADLAIDIGSSNTDLVDAAGIEIDRTTGEVEVTLTPLPDANGTTQLTLTVTDPAGESASSGFSLEVTPVNDAPTASAIADQSTQRDPINDIAFTIADIDSDIGDLTVTAVSSNEAVVPDANLTLGGAGADRTISVEPIAGGTTTITVVVSDGTASGGGTFEVEVTNNAPDAVTDSYAGIGNTVLSIAPGAGLLANDSDDDGDELSAIPATVATLAGGVAVIAADGSFVYTPQAGDTDVTDTFQYQVTDGFETSTGTATIDLTELVWYVKNDVADTGDGISSAPFKTLAEAETASGEGDVIYLFAGDGTTTGQDAGISLEDGQQLIGAGVPLVVGGVTLRNADENPVITNTGGVAVALSDNNTIAGLTIDEPSNDGISGPSVTALNIDTVTINAGGNAAIDIGNNNPAEDVSIDITGCTIDGTGVGGTPRLGIDVEFGESGGTAALELDITGNTIVETDDAIAIDLEGASGTGGTPNLVTVDNNVIEDFASQGVLVRNDQSSNNAVFVLNNTVDADVNTADASTGAGIDIQLTHEDAGGAVDLTIAGNTVSDAGTECVFVSDSSQAGNVTTLVALLEQNTLDGCGNQAIRVQPDSGVVTYNVTATDNLMTGNGAASSFTWGGNATAGAVLRVRLAGNNDDLGFTLGCNAETTTELDSLDNPGDTLTCPTDAAEFIAELGDQNNTSGALPPAGTLAGSGTVDLITTGSIPQPQ